MDLGGVVQSSDVSPSSGRGPGYEYLMTKTMNIACSSDTIGNELGRVSAGTDIGS